MPNIGRGLAGYAVGHASLCPTYVLYLGVEKLNGGLMVIACTLQNAAQSPQPVHLWAVNESFLPQLGCRVSFSAPVGHMPVQRGHSVQEGVIVREGKHRLKSVSETAEVRLAIVFSSSAFFFGSRRVVAGEDSCLWAELP